MRLVMVVVLVPLPSLLDSLSASFRRSAPSSSRSKLDVGDDRWDPSVNDYVVQNGFSVFQN